MALEHVSSSSVGLIEGGNLILPDLVFPGGETDLKGTLGSFPWVGNSGVKNWTCVAQPLLFICFLRDESAHPHHSIYVRGEDKRAGD